MSAKLLSHFFHRRFSFFCISMNRMAIIMYANLLKKKKELHVDNEGCVMNLRYVGYVHLLKENRIQN